MKRFFVFIGLTLVFAGCAQSQIATVESGCSKDGSTISMTRSEATQIAAEKCEGKVSGKSLCNPNSGTWWLDLDLEKQGCSPACVVNVETKGAVVNWRCTGVLSGTTMQ